MSLYNQTFVDNTGLLQKAEGKFDTYITLGKDYLLCAVFNRDKTTLYSLRSLYNDKGSIGQSEFDQLLADVPVRQSSGVYIAIDTPKQTLVPVQYLSPTDLAGYFKHIHEIEPGEEILQQNVNEEIEELFVVKKATLLYLKNEFSQYSLFSNSACILKNYAQHLQKAKGDAIYIHVNPSTFYFTFFKNNRLYLHQSFDLVSADDVLYCTLNALQLHGVGVQDVSVYLGGFSEQLQTIHQHLQPYFDLDIMSEATTEVTGDVRQDMPPHYLYNLYSLILCAS